MNSNQIQYHVDTNKRFPILASEKSQMPHNDKRYCGISLSYQSILKKIEMDARRAERRGMESDSQSSD